MADAHPQTIHINPPVPFKQEVDLKRSRSFTIIGRPTHDCKRFSIYFHKGREEEGDHVAFVLDVRFKFGKDKKYMVLNNKKGNNWGAETEIDIFPFSEKEKFYIEITLEEHKFVVHVNGRELGSFPRHGEVEMLTIMRDVTLTHVFY